MRIRTLRKSRGLRQVDLAKRARVDQSYVSQLETVTRAEPSLRVLRRLAKALDVPVSRLLGE